jgi:hypothetical protein
MKTLLLWAAAKNNPPRIPSKISESLVFPTPDVEDAASYLANAIHITRPDGENVLEYTRAGVLGCAVVQERLKMHVDLCSSMPS